MECGGFLRGFGKEVTIMYRSVILRKFDQDIVTRIVKYMKNEGVVFLKGSPLKFEKDKGGQIIVSYRETLEDGTQVE